MPANTPYQDFIAIYQLLRCIGRKAKAGEQFVSIGATSIAHETWTRIAKADSEARRLLEKAQSEGLDLREHEEFVRLLATVARRVVIDYARTKRADKRPTSGQRVDLDESWLAFYAQFEVELTNEDIAQALKGLTAAEAVVVDLRFFCGFTVEEVAEQLGLSTKTIKGRWQAAKARLERSLASYRA